MFESQAVLEELRQTDRIALYISDKARISSLADMLPVKIFMSKLHSRATQLILVKVQSEKFSISRGPIEFSICHD